MSESYLSEIAYLFVTDNCECYDFASVTLTLNHLRVYTKLKRATQHELIERIGIIIWKFF